MSRSESISPNEKDIVFWLQGAQEVFQEFPHEYIEPEYLPKVVKQGGESFGCFLKSMWEPG